MFVKAVHAHIDPVLASMFFETDFIQFDQVKKIIHLVTLKKFVMFQDLFIEQKHHYQEYLDRIFGFKTMLVVEFTKVDQRVKVERVQAGEEKRHFSDTVTGSSNVDRGQASSNVVINNQAVNNHMMSQRKVTASLSRNEKNIDIADEKKWKLAHRLIENFGGTVREIIKDLHEFDA
ncbi:MAG TPA: hypothetical protein VLG50_01815 [Candidatus Saccharimonadales bacterium]|nr:hypothetical protein [Candidatus Saccharimonadales bacterium]